MRLGFVLFGFPALETRWQLRDDGDGYRQIAATIHDGRYADVTRGPVYPFFVAMLPGMSVKVAQAVLDAGVCVLVWWLSGRRIGAAWLWAVYPFAIWRVGFVNKETLLTFLLAVYVCVQVRAWRLDCGKEWAFAGVWLGLVNLCKPTFLLWPVWLLVFEPRRAWITGLVMAAVIAPWTYRNWRVTGGEFLVVATEAGGLTTFVGNYQPTLGLWEGSGKARWQAAVEEIRAQNAGATAVQLDRAFYRAAWRQIAGNPLKAAELAVRKCYRFWFLSAKQREQVLSFVIQAGYLVLLGIGWWRARPWGRPEWGLVALVAYVMAVHAVSYADLRFSVIVMPYVCALACRTSATRAAATATS